ncbi:ABC transporter ATP-binding protein [Alcaligenaceae bacterium CGII-47]|nr:ABC transporter ATP-binding protein [Alcaligenaceae bacterium CGII-47]
MARPHPRSASIDIEDLGITLGSVEIVRGVSLHIRPGEFVCLLGPSGCGKSTVMNAIAGFTPASVGRIRLNGHDIKGPGADCGVVFQSTECLFPWLTVRENVEYSLRMRGIPSARRRELAMHKIRMVALEHAVDRFPDEISGGMRQRVQLARVLVNEPPVILMDEPFGALDAQTRRVMQVELNQIWRNTGATVLFITHDIGESILLADKIAIMTAGPLASIRSVTDVPLAHPRDLSEPRELELYRSLRAEIEEEARKALGMEAAATTTKTSGARCD